MKKRFVILPLVLAVLALLCFCAAFLILTYGVIKPLYDRILLLLLPTLIFLIIAYMGWEGTFTAKASTIITVFTAVVSLLGSIIFGVMLIFETAATSVTDPAYYVRIVQQLQGRPGLEYFPDTLPDNAKLYYTPQFLQGGEVFEVSLSMEEPDLRALCDTLEDAAQWYGDKNGYLKLTYHRLSSMKDSDTIYVLYQKGDNHGEEAYVLVSPSDRKVTFYYSHW